MGKKKKTEKKKSKKSNKSNSTTAQLNLISELTNGITDLAEVTITIPLSNVTKKLHARMFIQTKLSLPELQNMKKLGQIFKTNAYFYNDKYVKNVWFIKKTKVTVTPTDKSMTLTLLPFNDSYESEASTLAGLTENNTQESTATVQIKGDSFLQDIVKKAIGTKTDIEDMAIACYKYYQNHHVYELTSTDVVAQYNRGFKSLWNQYKQSCGPGAATLYYMFKAIGLDPKIMNGHYHYWIQVEINGKTYYCDQAGAEGTHNVDKTGSNRVMSTSTGDHTVYGGATGGSVRMG